MSGGAPFLNEAEDGSRVGLGLFVLGQPFGDVGGSDALVGEVEDLSPEGLELRPSEGLFPIRFFLGLNGRHLVIAALCVLGRFQHFLYQYISTIKSVGQQKTAVLANSDVLRTYDCE